MKKYKVTLTESEIEILEEITRKGKRSAMIIRNAYILLNSNQGSNGKSQKDEDIASFLNITVRTVENIREKFVLDGFETALYGKSSPREYKAKVDGDVEAHLIALSCSEPPKGRVRWSLRLLSDKMVELQYIDKISHETVRTVLKKRIKTVESKGLANITTQQ
ncbi:hypothetical protein L21SP5_02975 [Salinivirga cyanobacteriivorans]|uniref:Transposase n=1 Tax=Salinivirga cyanobacteriivorans TaxID=1307839 RepID=A0A0S2I2D9_9BACT|nr:hypothetical protein L21SP5_02975 [Salinivirga cyanobacteriivorans]